MKVKVLCKRISFATTAKDQADVIKASKARKPKPMVSYTVCEEGEVVDLPEHAVGSFVLGRHIQKVDTYGNSSSKRTRASAGKE